MNVPQGYKHAWYVFTVRLNNVTEDKRNRVVKTIRENKVGATIYYSKPIHLQGYYQKYFSNYSLPETEVAAKQVFSLPVHPSISENELRHIIKVVKKSVE
jgi:dTDP-4-amino-4,6-dideoxygalactose transaminase